jgi:hypothetical protein
VTSGAAGGPPGLRGGTGAGSGQGGCRPEVPMREARGHLL